MVAFSKFAIGVTAFFSVAVSADEATPAAADVDVVPSEMKEAVAEVTKDETTETGTTTAATDASIDAEAASASAATDAEAKAEDAELDALDAEEAPKSPPSAEEIAEVKELLKKLLAGEQVEGAEEKLDQILAAMPPDTLTEIFQEVFPADMMQQMQMGQEEEMPDLDPAAELSDADADAMDADDDEEGADAASSEAAEAGADAAATEEAAASTQEDGEL